MVQITSKIENKIIELINFDSPKTVNELFEGMLEAVLFQEQQSNEKMFATFDQYRLVQILKSVFNEVENEKQNALKNERCEN